MHMTKKILTTLLAVLLVAGAAHAQEISTNAPLIPSPSLGVKTNLLMDLTASISLGVEIKTGRKTTFDFPVSYNPWSFKDNDMKWKHFLVQPEMRYWFRQAFNGPFVGIHAHYAYYNIGGLPNPPFSEYMNTHRFQGWLAGAGVSFGYQWILSPRLSLEATLGVGHAYMDYDIYDCLQCPTVQSSEIKEYYGPTKAGISLIYIIK